MTVWNYIQRKCGPGGKLFICRVLFYRIAKSPYSVKNALRGYTYVNDMYKLFEKKGNLL